MTQITVKLQHCLTPDAYIPHTEFLQKKFSVVALFDDSDEFVISGSTAAIKKAVLYHYAFHADEAAALHPGLF